MKGVLVFVSFCVFAAVAYPGPNDEPTDYLKTKWLILHYVFRSDEQDKCYFQTSQAVKGAKERFWKETIFRINPALMTEDQLLKHLVNLYSSNKEKFEQDTHAFCVKKSKLYDKDKDGTISRDEFFHFFECLSFTDAQITQLCHAHMKNKKPSSKIPFSYEECSFDSESYTEICFEFLTNPSRAVEEYHIADAFLEMV